MAKQLNKYKLPKNQEQWFKGKTMDDLKIYNARTLYNGKDIWDLFKEVKEYLWVMYSAYIEEGKEPQKAYEEASHMAWVHSVYQVMCDDCNHNFQTINKADEYFLYSVEPYETIMKNWNEE